jgi:hypothetical protein
MSPHRSSRVPVVIRDATSPKLYDDRDQGRGDPVVLKA